MKTYVLVSKILFGIFFTICIAVHVIGLFKPFSSEPMWSHVVHTLSYCACIYTFLNSVRYRLWIYITGAVYPFLYHVHCAWVSYSELGKFNPICWLVVFMMPLAGFLIWHQEKFAGNNQ